jgi:hypothetical protein
MKNKKILETNLSQFGVQEHFQIIYSLYIISVLLLFN